MMFAEMSLGPVFRQRRARSLPVREPGNRLFRLGGTAWCRGGRQLAGSN